jgi:hypothetical protein
MPRSSVWRERSDIARILEWDLPDGGAVKLEVHRVAVQE